jgi:ribosomal protein S17E
MNFTTYETEHNKKLLDEIAIEKSKNFEIHQNQVATFDSIHQQVFEETALAVLVRRFCL